MAEDKKKKEEETKKKVTKEQNVDEKAAKKAASGKKTAEKKAAETKGEKFEFQSEVKQLLNILVYSLYQHKEVFLRELISNSVDALNKVKFQTLLNSDIEDKEIDLQIDITFDIGVKH